MIPIARPSLGEKEAKAAYEAVMSGWVTQGPRVEEFEKGFASYIGIENAVAVSSCTTALHLSMLVSNIGVGDEVICPSLTYIASANAIVHSGATPVFAEVADGTYNIDPNVIHDLITPRTKAIVLVHQMGFPVDINTFAEIAKNRNLVLIEDAACAVGSINSGARIGSSGNLTCFSFHPRKLLTTGDGGMITTNDDRLADRLRRLRNHGMNISPDKRHASGKMIFEEHIETGYNYRMTDIQAAVGIVQLDRIDEILGEHRRISSLYNEMLEKDDVISVQNVSQKDLANYQSYPVFINNVSSDERDCILEKMKNDGISAKRGIMTCHRESVYRNTGLKLPVSERMSDQSILLPIYAGLSEDEMTFIIERLRYHI